MALRYCALLLVAVASLVVTAAPVADPEEGTELVFAFMVHRHGDRTPETTNILPTLNLDNEEVHALIDQWGWGELTDVGRRSAYRMGEFIRRRYNDLIAPKYSDSEIYIRSTDYTRTKMTVLTALAAVFPPVGENWSEDVNWTPVPYTTVPLEDDYVIEPGYACTSFGVKIMTAEQPPVLEGFEDVLSKLAAILGNDDVMTPMQVGKAWTDLSSLVSMGYDLGEELTELYPQLFPAFDAFWAFDYKDDDIAKMGAGTLLDEFFVYADKIIKGEQTQTVRVYSAHDANVYPFQRVTKVTPQGRPLYASLYSLELRRVVATGEYVVLPVYLRDPNEGTETRLQVSGCDVLCGYEQFKDITAAFRLPEDTFRKMTC